MNNFLISTMVFSLLWQIEIKFLFCTLQNCHLSQTYGEWQRNGNESGRGKEIVFSRMDKSLNGRHKRTA